MAVVRSVVLAAGVVIAVEAQQAGHVTTESPPPMHFERCTLASGCHSEPAFVTLDANWRWVHNTGGYTNCFTGSDWNPAFCSSGQECARRCALEGVDATGYAQTYGIEQINGGINLKFVSEGGNVGSRVYLSDGDSYKMFHLKNREFTFDVDVSALECGLNGAVYFVEMDEMGGKGQGHNQAGAKYGTGYCDAQCPHDVKWQEGEANIGGDHGMCCVEMDIWEANNRATAFTPHPCQLSGPLRCSGTECGDGASGERYAGVCDKDGCDLNAWRMGSQTHFGPGSGFDVDANKPVTVVTQFITDNGQDTGDLVEIKRFYVQEGRIIQHADSKIPGVSGSSISDEFCTAQKTAFLDIDDHKLKGGLKNMGEALDRGMVLALSLWDDGATNMRWLDSTFPAGEGSSGRLGVERGPCDGSTSSPSFLRTNMRSADVQYTNIRFGEIGSTTQVHAASLLHRRTALRAGRTHVLKTD